MRVSPFLPLLALFALLPACSGNSGPPASPPDAGHDVDVEAKEDTGTPVFDTGAPTGESGQCASLGVTWMKMDHAPILLADPKLGGDRVVGGLDIDGGGKGLTIPEVVAQLCAGNPLGRGPGGTLIEGWGDSNELRLDYNATTLFVEGVALFPGYVGTMTLPTDPAGPDAGHTFTVGLGAMQKDGQPFLIDWTDVEFAAGNELYNALQYNSACYAGYDAAPCKKTGACTVTMSGTERQFSIDQVSLTLDFELGGSEAAESTVVEIDLLP